MKKTIAILVNETVRYPKRAIGYSMDQHCVYEAFDSYAKALDAMAEEYNSFASERVFKQETIKHAEMSEPGSIEPYGVIEYIDSEGVYLAERFSVECIDLDVS